MMTETVVEQTAEESTGAAIEAAPVALVAGEPLFQLPGDLYIPPSALEVLLETFEGPLDLLLYLIRKQNFDILDIPIAEITRQYSNYVELMHEFQLELAAEYLVMAAMLAEIKSRLLLPRPRSDEEEDDPRAELVRRLQEYEQIKQAAQDIDHFERLERDTFLPQAEIPPLKKVRPQPEVKLDDLLFALSDVMQRAKMQEHHMIKRETLSLRDRMTQVLHDLKPNEFVLFTSLFNPNEGRQGVVVTLLAVLELSKSQMIDIVQSQPFAPLHVSAVAQAHDNPPELIPTAAV